MKQQNQTMCQNPLCGCRCVGGGGGDRVCYGCGKPGALHTFQGPWGTRPIHYEADCIAKAREYSSEVDSQSLLTSLEEACKAASAENQNASARYLAVRDILQVAVSSGRARVEDVVRVSEVLKTLRQSSDASEAAWKVAADALTKAKQEAASHG